MSIESDKQLNKEISVMYNKMRDPVEHEKSYSKDKVKKNVEHKTTRFGL